MQPSEPAALVAAQLDGLDGQQAVSSQRRQQRQRQRRARSTRGRAGLLCFRVPSTSGPSLIAQVPASEAQKFRREHPGARVCTVSTGAAAAPVNVNRLLDVSNDGTFAGARRAAILGHQDPLVLGAAIGGLARAAEQGRVDAGFAAARIAQLASPPLAAAQAELRAPALTRAELLEQARRRQAGLSDSALVQAQIRKLEEQCLPRVCFVEGDKVTGRAFAITFATITPQQAAATRGFLRFCGKDDLRAAGHLDTSWGQWFTDGIARARASLGLGEGPARRELVIALPGAPVPPPAPVVTAPTIDPGGLYAMRSPDGKIIAMVPGSQVQIKLSQGWTLA